MANQWAFAGEIETAIDHNDSDILHALKWANGPILRRVSEDGEILAAVDATGMLAEFVRQVGGREVRTVDPATKEPRDIWEDATIAAEGAILNAGEKASGDEWVASLEATKGLPDQERNSILEAARERAGNLDYATRASARIAFSKQLEEMAEALLSK